ncbi:2-methylcitrate dehydratase PrpD [Rhizodiscina lignyota]|uniref:2-methylcitrate dehydratase PrpD n=1 Tax=Rhizodiscina lignyota TaxID=1504668 RepID=A0A9P4MEI0_9PEZI|nr:2-methylcitrate dehydratase PrpD [Rhizodiscina lignyota]
MSTNGATNATGQDSLTRLTARRLRQIASNNVPTHLKEKAALAVLDYLGAVASGFQAPWAPQVVQYARKRKGVPESYAWGLGEDTSAETAAFVNSVLAHSAIRDDMHLKSNSHIGSMVISAALALAQREGWTGEQLLKGIIGAYDAASFLGVAVQQSPGYNRHIRPSGICGAFGSAAAAIAATNVSEEVAVNALAFAANMASGFNEWAWIGGTEIYVEMGTASQSGIAAFDLANAGMQCSETILEGRAGLFAAFNASQGESLFRKGLAGEIGKGLMDIRFKPVPGCNYAQTPLATALRCTKNHDLSAGIKRVVVDCTIGAKNYPGCDNPGPFSTIQETKMSIQFGVCGALLNGNVSEQLFKKYHDATITKMAAECVVEAAKEYDQSFSEGRQPARVEVTLADGTTVKEELPDVPWVDSNGVVSRFLEDTKPMLSSEDSRKKMDLAEGINWFRGSQTPSSLPKGSSEAWLLIAA